MNLAAIAASTPATSPNQPPLPGLEDAIVARVPPKGGIGGGPIKVRSDRPIGAPLFGAFDAAVDAARTIMQADRKDARWGWFKRHPGPVESIALVDTADGIRLLRTNYPVDRYKEPVPGQMFPGQNWTIGVPQAIVRERPSSLALVGADNLFDLRSGQVVGPTPYARD